MSLEPKGAIPPMARPTMVSINGTMNETIYNGGIRKPPDIAFVPAFVPFFDLVSDVVLLAFCMLFEFFDIIKPLFLYICGLTLALYQ